jgi:hypothetical protein
LLMENWSKKMKSSQWEWNFWVNHELCYEVQWDVWFLEDETA